MSLNGDFFYPNGWSRHTGGPAGGRMRDSDGDLAALADSFRGIVALGIARAVAVACDFSPDAALAVAWGRRRGRVFAAGRGVGSALSDAAASVTVSAVRQIVYRNAG